MFCADYLISFIFHYSINQSSVYVFNKLSANKKDSHFYNSSTKLVYSLCVSSVTGLACACVLYPFDFVRMSTVKSGTSHFGYGIIPFTSLYLGVYFWKMNSNETNLQNKLQLALLSTAAGCLIEYPFDYSKQNIFGHGQLKNWKLGLLTNVMRIPLGAFLLVVYDRIYFRYTATSDWK